VSQISLRPKGLTTIALVNGIAAIVTLTFWLLVQRRLFGSQKFPDVVDRSSLATTLGFMIADTVWGLPLLILSAVGLWHSRFWGWATAQMVNILWFYALTIAWVRDVYLGSISPGSILFLPFTLFAVWATIYLWRHRSAFGVAGR
jgi:hypothetical protein